MHVLPLSFLPDNLVGQTTLDSRLRGGGGGVGTGNTSSAYDSYSPHHQLTMTASGHHLKKANNGSPCRSPATNSAESSTGGGGGGVYPKHPGRRREQKTSCLIQVVVYIRREPSCGSRSCKDSSFSFKKYAKRQVLSVANT